MRRLLQFCGHFRPFPGTQRVSDMIRSDKEIVKMIRHALGKKLPKGSRLAIGSTGDEIYITVRSREFEKLDESARHDFVWEEIDSTELTDREKLRIGMIQVLSPQEVEMPQ